MAVSSWKTWLWGLGLLVACIAGARPKVVATVSDLGAIAREVGGDLVEVQVLARSTQDPHFIDPRPALKISLARADLLLVNGVGLEVGWLPVLLTDSRNAKIQVGNPGYLDASTVVTLREVPTEKLDRSMGDIHPGGNPHFTRDPRSAVPLARAIAQRLAQLDPENAAKYEAQRSQFEQRVLAKVAEWQQAFAPYAGTPVVTFHKSWIYFTEFAGLTEVAFIEPKPGIPPNPEHILKVLKVIRARQVPLLLQEDWYSANVGEVLARQSGAKLLRVPGQTREGSTYLDGLSTVVQPVLDALAASRRGP